MLELYTTIHKFSLGTYNRGAYSRSRPHRQSTRYRNFNQAQTNNAMTHVLVSRAKGEEERAQRWQTPNTDNTFDPTVGFKKMPQSISIPRIKPPTNQQFSLQTNKLTVKNSQSFLLFFTHEKFTPPYTSRHLAHNLS